MTKTANQLINESSAYLLQHAYNPVQWQAWTAEALAQAVKEDKPIMLSIGYAACHWCHVMEHESFEDEQVAKILNENFVAIKVDREERPDIDEIYMTAVQLMTGHGGWPLTVFLTPDGKPFFGGTYFPKENRQYGQQVVPGFKTILNAVIRSWKDQRQEIKGSAQNITDAISDLNDQITKDVSSSPAANEQLALGAGLHLLSLFDKEWGGFGQAPKFPQVLCLSLCLRLAFKLKQLNDQRHELFLEALSTSLDCMARGGIYDHLGGGFARYSTERKWRVPHFEKMLYDNALLAQLYLDAYSFAGNKRWLETGRGTLDFIERELYSKEGGFYSSLDADSEGKEGKFYVWTKAEITEILGADADWFCQQYSVSEEGNFEAGENILYQKANANTEKDTKLLKEKLFAHRAKRVRPGTDDKILTSWNGLTITAFVTGYRITGEEKYLEIAKKAGSFILSHLYRDGRLNHVYAGGKAKISGYLDDYAFFVQALLDLCSVDENPVWLNEALALTETTLQHFYSAKQGDFFYTADDQEKLISRTKNNADGPIPSSTSVAALNLIKLATITGNDQYRQIANKVLDQFKVAMVRIPSQYANMACSLDRAQSNPGIFVFAASGNKKIDKVMLNSLYAQYLPDKLLLIKGPDTLDIGNKFSILADKVPIDNSPVVYLCDQNGCQPPIKDIDILKVKMSQLVR